MLTDKSTYFAKMPLNSKGRFGVRSPYCIYCALIASYIAKNSNVEAADITLGGVTGWPKILSKNFLKPNEELITYAEDTEGLLISDQLKKLEEALKLRRFPEEEIQQAKFDFLKQEFIAKIIGLQDQSAENSPIIISTDETGNKHVKMAPMYDLDYSFHIAEESGSFFKRKCDNGKDDIGSLIEQYQDYPGFKQFVMSVIQTFSMEEIFKQIYENTGLTKFRNYKDDEEMIKFINYVNKNIRIS